MAEMHRPPAPPLHVRRIAGVDLGKRTTPATLAVLESVSGRTEWDHLRYGWAPAASGPERALRYLNEFPLLTEYSEIAARLWRTATALELDVLCVDATGVGEAVVEMLRERQPASSACRVQPIVLTSGINAVQAGDQQRVPRRELLLRLALEIEQGRVKAPHGLPLWPRLCTELRHLDAEGKKSKGHSDDLAIAVALALWGSLTPVTPQHSAGERPGRLF